MSGDAAGENTERDAVDEIVGQWLVERPDLADDLWPVHVFGRLQRLGAALDKRFRAFAAERGLELGEFDVLTTLQRSGPPYELTAGAFRKAAMVTSGAITNRIDRMEAKGLVERVRDTADRRSVKIRLTERGRELTRAYMADHLAHEARMLERFDRAETEELADLMRRLLVSFGDTTIK
ncbi:MarR family winged helix-turn-helix transcriptional regulator [Streptomyces albireticuli]|uniref:MarR family transcriptional regulator n=1 Tax=Streptomyces albireticuli TaxID=1940 RepID=A0A2A2D5F8_9ACTN|nr:MarR family transcriptional regulator [Streptomyces albireticuli]MCD9141125.1 MarR family transcriptional regulator [Streptomyces albireticuli]MCD9160914.1 MarR family transcriptional regulator [Streptomyces albireticuli]MCD9191029.1 MarR family transcriptional regulator [Streptomyces albireticuli]PAU46542.1 MarR family transcriptional regulator [Streptomyces albireticuli]